MGVVLLGLLAASCGSRSSDSDPDSQAHYQQEIIKSRKKMFQGEIRYTPLRGARVGQSLEVRAEVEGFRVAQSQGERAEAERRTGKLLVGTLIGVKLRCSGAGATCTALSSERQNVLTPDDRATWRWMVRPSSTGQMMVALTVTAYHRDTDNVLFEQPPYVERVSVGTTTAHTAQSAKDDMGEVLAVLGAVLGLGVAYVTIDEFRGRRSGRKGETGAKKKSPPRRTRQPSPSRVRRRNRP
ncbi:hypothetical protein [Streptomyces aureocirculatus]|uniref:hypothetical protein n=1 Tax=Streptomyces aureocirculatus TaxID=67275 RepID=UPI0004CA815C|nr:hypothetical protein [Streptomyces aureocirculatus]